MNKKETFKLIANFIRQSKNSVLAIVGPTASGKTELSIEIARQFEGEIISADSRQIYKYLDLGTAKISPEEQQNIPHYLLDIINPDQKFSVAEFQNQAVAQIKEIQARDKLPILVGGTGLYLDAVLYNFSIPQATDPQIRKKLETEWEEKGAEEMWKKLQKLDPQATEKIPAQNKHHLLRALEVILTTGQSKFELAQKKQARFESLIIAPHWEREILYERINQRVLQMFQDGLIEETQKVLQMGFAPNCPGLSSIGYREIIQFLKNEMSQEEVVTLIQQKTRNYAKRQLTWFRRNKKIKFVFFD